MINHDVSRKFGGDIAAAADAIRADLLVVVDVDDHLVTPGPALGFAEMVGALSLVLHDDCGHLSPFQSCSGNEMSSAISAFLSRND